MPLTRQRVLTDLAQAAELEEVDPQDELFDLGVDSVRLMSMVQAWSQHREVTFRQVAACRTVAEVIDLLDAT